MLSSFFIKNPINIGNSGRIFIKGSCMRLVFQCYGSLGNL